MSTTITIPFDKIDLTKATLDGLKWILEIAVETEEFEKAAKIKSELDKRQLK